MIESECWNDNLMLDKLKEKLISGEEIESIDALFARV